MLDLGGAAEATALVSLEGRLVTADSDVRVLSTTQDAAVGSTVSIAGADTRDELGAVDANIVRSLSVAHVGRVAGGVVATSSATLSVTSAACTTLSITACTTLAITTGAASSALSVASSSCRLGITRSSGSALGIASSPSSAAHGVASSSCCLSVLGVGYSSGASSVSVASLTRSGDDSGGGEGEDSDDAVRDHFDRVGGIKERWCLCNMN